MIPITCSCWNKHLETDGKHESVPNGTTSSVETESSQESKGEGSWKQEQKSTSSSSTSTGKQGPSVNKEKIEKKSGTERGPMHHYMGKVCKYIQKKLEVRESSIKELGEVKTNILVWGLFLSSSMKAAVFILDKIWLRTVEYAKENQVHVQHRSEIDVGKFR